MNNVNGQKYDPIKPIFIINGIKINGHNMKGSEIMAAFLTPNVLIKVCTPVSLSALLSEISFVDIPPIRNTVATVPIIKGNF